MIDTPQNNPFPIAAHHRLFRRGLQRGLHRRLVAILGSFLIAATCTGQSIPNKFVLGSVGYAASEQGALKKFDMRTTLDLSLGYLFAVNRNVQIGAVGHWMPFMNNVTSAPIDPADGDSFVIDNVGHTNSLTVLQMMAQVRLRPIKHGFSPYLDLEGGMCYVSHVDVVLPCLAAAVGVQIPISERVDIDVRVRTSWAPKANAEVLITAFHVGFVYALPRTQE